MIPVHPQPYPGHPDRLRWIVPAGVLTVVGPLAAVPAPLAALLTDGTLAEIVVEPTAVVTGLGPGHHWPIDGSRVRTAIHAALDEPAGWIPAHDTGDNGLDAVLFTLARDLLDGTVGQFARSHGGRIELVGVHDGVVTVRLTGACHGCPAARITLHQRLERELRRRYPALRAVVDASSSTTASTPKPSPRLWWENRD
ncbi:NifU family protein [Micromonospora orduensis]|uniref:NifU family protein n=1 Tax=Micromonospora orduensis TaxID=1420891 RepID=A0A5C4QUJ8_9ACTN|nr:NifU family protein [Micromonospora orduensis]TNH28500.1 NifU family protein [Micromonospora orduensis]